MIVTILKCILNKFHGLLLGRGAFLCYSFFGGNRIKCSIASVSLSVHCNIDNPPFPPKRWIALKIIAFCWSRVKELKEKLFPCIVFFHTDGLRVESHVISSIAPKSSARESLYTQRGVNEIKKCLPSSYLQLVVADEWIDSCGMRRSCFI